MEQQRLQARLMIAKAAGISIKRIADSCGVSYYKLNALSSTARVASAMKSIVEMTDEEISATNAALDEIRDSL